MTIIILGQCTRVKDGAALFNFRGYWKNHLIREIRVEAESSWQVKSEYVLKVEVLELHAQTLHTKLIARRELL
jgi:hypothetical protein